MEKQNTATVKDAKGRVIEIRKLKPLERMRLIELVGADNSANDRYLGYATLAYCVNSIDGAPVGRPGSKIALESVIQELDDEGIDAVGKGITENFLSTATVEGSLKNE